jgi:hypothetical protein
MRGSSIIQLFQPGSSGELRSEFLHHELDEAGRYAQLGYRSESAADLADVELMRYGTTFMGST